MGSTEAQKNGDVRHRQTQIGARQRRRSSPARPCPLGASLGEPHVNQTVGGGEGWFSKPDVKTLLQERWSTLCDCETPLQFFSVEKTASRLPAERDRRVEAQLKDVQQVSMSVRLQAVALARARALKC